MNEQTGTPAQVIEVDALGRRYATEVMPSMYVLAWYVTDCHDAAATVSGGVMCCRVCYEEVEEWMGAGPDLDQPEAGAMSEKVKFCSPTCRTAYAANCGTGHDDPMGQELATIGACSHCVKTR